MLTLEQVWPWRTMEYWNEEGEGKRERWYHDRYRVTWEAIGRARHTAQQDLERAQKRRWVKACAFHDERLMHLDMLLEICAPLMADHPTRTLAEAWALLSPQTLKVVKEL